MLLKTKYEDLNQKKQQEFKNALLGHNISPRVFFENHSKKPIHLLPLGIFLTYAELLKITKEDMLREEPRLAILMKSTQRTKKNTFTTTPQF